MVAIYVGGDDCVGDGVVIFWGSVYPILHDFIIVGAVIGRGSLLCFLKNGIALGFIKQFVGAQYIKGLDIGCKNKTFLCSRRIQNFSKLGELAH